MSSPKLTDINWDAAAAAAGGGLTPAHAAQVLSLSALYTPDYPTAAARLRRAARMEPLNPLHTLRRALLLARFGDTARAEAELKSLKQALPDSPLLDYLRGLLALRAGRPEQARAIGKTLETAHPDFAHGKFLRAEAQVVLATKTSAIEKQLVSLPAEPRHEPLWADLLTKVALLHPQGGPEQAEKYLSKKVRRGTPADEAVRRALAWARANAKELEDHLARERPGSRAEALILSCLFERLERGGDNAGAAERVAALRRRHPERAALKRLESVFLARMAVEKSGAGHNGQALPFVERCLRDQPHDQLYHQNRAALFTLLGEPGPYYEAWLALNRHQYRLVLLGAADRLTLEQVARGHRLFAQQAQGAGLAGSAVVAQRGIFRRLPASEDGGLRPVAVDREEIAADPELLRQWIHHGRAELVFRHLLLGADPHRFLLHPADRDESLARVESLSSFAESLSTLVPEEGELLAEALAARWRDAAGRTRTRYAAELPDADVDEEVLQLRLHHLELLGALALFCLQWRPGAHQLATAEELLAFVRAERAFFDDRLLSLARRQNGSETSYPVLVLADHVRRFTGIENDAPLPPEQRRAAVDALMTHLLRGMAGAAYEAAAGTQKEQVNRAMSYIDRARACNPGDVYVELAAARYLVVGDFHDEAAAALKRFHRLVAPDEQDLLADAEQVEQILRERREKGGGKRRQMTNDPEEEDAGRGGEERITELEQELDRAPSSWRLYEEMVRELEMLGRFDEAVDWADRAVAHCLSRALQMNARALAIEARALRTLAADHPRAARLYPVGAHEPARKALESVAAAGELDYALLFLLGRCELAAGSPAAAREAFGRAAACCDRLLHRAVLRHLTDGIDNAYLAVARASVNSSLQDKSPDEAVREAASVFARLQDPAAWLVDFARVFYSATLGRIGSAQEPLAPQRVTGFDAPWLGRLNEILAQEDDVARALAIATLAVEEHPPSRQQAQALCERVRTLQRQLALTEALNVAGRLLKERRFEEALAAAEDLDPSFAAEPRFMRLRVLALLGLNRFDEADLLMEQATDGTAGAELREFVSGYPTLAFRQRMAAAQRLLHEAQAEKAAAVLAGARPTNDGEAADLAYCLAFGLTLSSYQLRRQRREADARARVLRAMDLLEPHLRGAGAGGRPHLVELYDRLDKESETYGRA
jgi:hypothetical protein